VSAAYAKSTSADERFSSAHEQMEKLVAELQSSKMLSAQHSEVESFVKEGGRELERLLYQAHLDVRAARERPVPVRGADEVERSYRRPSRRPLGTILGRVMVARLAYQALGVEGLHPMDAALNLPPELYSHGVSRFVAEHAAMMAFDDVVGELLTATGSAVGKRQVEEIAVRAATDFEAFYKQRRAANDVLEETRDLLALTFDGKGIVMVPEDLRPATQKAARKKVRSKLATRLTAGEKRNRKRMAEVAAVYTVPRFRRTPLDILADLYGEPDEQARRDRRARRPPVRNKRVWASVEHDPQVVIDEAFREAEARDPKHRRIWVVLLDGNKDQLALTKAAAKKLGVEVTIVVDLMHALEYLWCAAHAFHEGDPKAAEQWVQQRLLWLLQGRPAGKIATAMRRSACAAHLRDSRLEAVREAANYLQKYAPYMRYGDAIDQGLPIATGVIEGACRYLVKDRMDPGGARWTLDGAEAVLRLRALRASGDFNDYWPFHLREELRRNHAERYADACLPDPVRPLKRVK
jgi:hypothetical protein